MEYQTLAANLAGRIRRATLNGRDYYVAPVSLLVSGVLRGSRGALYYPPDEIARNPDWWNGMPLLNRHPRNGGSGRNPQVYDEQGLGHLYNVAYDRARSRLTGEGWFDAQLVRHHDRHLSESQRIEPRLLRGEPIELSTGLYTDNEPARNGASCPKTGRAYTHIARNYRPDHLAILPGEVGACSVSDGCGVLINSSSSSGGNMPIVERFLSVMARLTGNAGGQPSDDIDADKACQILHDGTVHGQELTDEQRRMFGAACGNGGGGDKGGGKTKNAAGNQGRHNATGRYLNAPHTSAAKGFSGGPAAGESNPDGRNVVRTEPDPEGGVESDESDDHDPDALEEGQEDIEGEGAGGKKVKGAADGGKVKNSLVSRIIGSLRNIVTHAESQLGAHPGQSGQGKFNGLRAKSERAELMTERARDASLKAEDDDGHKTAKKAHQEAATAHRDAAKEAGKQDAQTKMPNEYSMANYHDNRAKFHDDRAYLHDVKSGGKGTNNMSTTWNVWSDAAREAAVAARSASQQGGSKEAHSATVAATKATRSTLSGSGKHAEAAAAHDKAASAHQEAAKDFKELGDSSLAKAHGDAAAAHKKMAATHRAKVGEVVLHQSFLPSSGPGVSYMDPHDATLQAAGASLQHAGAREHAVSAVDSSADGDHPAAAKAHVAAAKVHEKEATDARKDKDPQVASEHDNAAALHRKAASMHAATGNTLQGLRPLPAINEWSDAAREAAAAGRQAHGASAAAEVEDTPTAHEKAADAHMTAVKAHAAAGKSAKAEGNKEGMKVAKKGINEHKEAAAYHATMAIPTTNKDFVSDDERKAAFAAMAEGGELSSDAKSASAKAEKTQKPGDHKAAAAAHREAAAHHKDEGNTEHAAAHAKMAKHHDYMAKKTIHNRRRQSYNSRATGVPEPLRRRLMALTREQKVAVLTANCKCEEDKTAINALSDDALDSVLLTNAKPDSSNADEQRSGTVQAGGEDEDEESDDDDYADEAERQVKAKSPKNPGTGTSNMKSFKHYLESYGTPDEKAAWNHVLNAEREERLKYARALVANVEDPKRRQELGTRMMKKPLGELKQLYEEKVALGLVGNRTERLPSSDTGGYTDSPSPSFLGAAGGPLTSNTGEPGAGDDTLEIATLNYAAIARENDRMMGRQGAAQETA